MELDVRALKTECSTISSDVAKSKNPRPDLPVRYTVSTRDSTLSLKVPVALVSTAVTANYLNDRK